MGNSSMFNSEDDNEVSDLKQMLLDANLLKVNPCSAADIDNDEDDIDKNLAESKHSLTFLKPTEVVNSLDHHDSVKDENNFKKTSEMDLDNHNNETEAQDEIKDLEGKKK